MPREVQVDRDNVDYHGHCYQRGSLDACEGRFPLPPLKHSFRYLHGYINVKLMPVTELFGGLGSLFSGWDMSQGTMTPRNPNIRPTSSVETK